MLRVLGSRIVVEIMKEEVRKSSLTVVQGHKEPRSEGIVTSVGPGTRLQDGTLIPVDVQVGDHVIYSRMAGVPFKAGNKELLVINERDVIAVMTEDEAEDNYGSLNHLIEEEVKANNEALDALAKR